MKILIISDYESEEGGVEVFDTFLEEGLRFRDHDVEKFSKPEGRSIYTKFLSKSDLAQFKEEIKNFSPDVIFVHSIGKNLSPIILREAQKTSPVVMKLPDILTYQKEDFLSGKFLFVQFFWSRILRHSLKNNVDYFVPPSKNSEKWLIDDLGIEKSKVETVRNPVMYEPVNNPEVPEDNIILYVGRMHPSKGVKYLLEAFNKLVETTEAKLILVGGGEELEDYRSYVSANSLQDSVKFTGKIGHQEVKDHYREASVFVLPSIVEENSPLTILEAMSQGTPAITTGIGGQEELVKENQTGLLVEPENSEDLYKSLEKILSDRKLLEQMSESSLKESTRFTKSQHIEKLDEIFERIAK